ncbi:hypothetical protein TNCV_4177811 [Trichonephila clavipes]|nr:hypothetical protein TNCV_4177811 [Trichonephila clavipes]
MWRNRSGMQFFSILPDYVERYFVPLSSSVAFLILVSANAEKLAVSNDFYSHQDNDTKQMVYIEQLWLFDLFQANPLAFPVSRFKPNTAFVGFTTVDSQEARNNI